MQDVNSIVKLYSDYVEHYEINKDPISFYFMEKIQLLLSSQDTIKALSQIEKVKKGELPEITEDILVRRPYRAPVEEVNLWYINQEDCLP